MLSIIKPSGAFSYCYSHWRYGECHYGKCRGAKSDGQKQVNQAKWFLDVKKINFTDFFFVKKSNSHTPLFN